MNEQFYTILTQIGKAKIANATALGTKINIVKFHVGDGNGSYYNPTEEQTQLKNKLWEGNISSIRVDDENPNWIILEAVIPGSDGGFMVREVGAVDSDGNLIAIGKFPETYKPIAGDGSVKDLILKMVLEVSNTSSVTLKIDPTVILATKKDFLDLEEKVNNLENSISKMELTSTKVTRPNGKTVETSLSEHDREIESLKLSVSDGKKEVASAITDKGVPTLATDTFKTMSDNIREIVSYSELSIKISVQMEEPVEPKDGDLWLVTDITPGRIVLSYDESKAVKEEGLVFIKLKFLDIVCNFNEQISSLLEIPNQVVIDFDKVDKRLDIRGVGIAKGGVIDLYADFSHAKIFKDSKFEYVQFKYYHNGQWVTLDNGFDYMYIIRNGNIALFNPVSKSVIWERMVGTQEYPAFGVDADDKLLISGDNYGSLLSRLDKQGNLTKSKYSDSEALSREYLNIIGNADGTTLLSYPLNTDYTAHVKLSKTDEVIWKISHPDRILNHVARYAFNFLSGIVMDNEGGFAVIYYYYHRDALRQDNTCARFFDNKGKQIGYSSNFFTLKTDHYISKVKQNKKGEIFALATAKKDTSPVSKSILYKYNTYEDFKNRKTSNNIAFTNTFYINDFVVVNSTKIVLIQSISDTTIKVVEIDTDTMTKIKEFSVNIQNGFLAYSCDREGNIITPSQSISLNGTVSPLNGLSQVTDTSANEKKYRCISTVIDKYFE